MQQHDIHPCYNPAAATRHARIHLPVAASCNIGCRFCNRDYDCPNESRPGVSSALLTPRQAAHYLEKAWQAAGPYAVVGIAGPGDPFADPAPTLETLTLVRERFPDVLLCVATNGLAVSPWVDDLARLAVRHVSITINAVDPAIGARIVAWVRPDKRPLRGEEGAALLRDRQLDALTLLKGRGITVKVNIVVIPGINDAHVEAIAREAALRGADTINCMPLIGVAGSEFANMPRPDHETMQKARWMAGQHLTVVRHCNRCRADAAGLLGDIDQTLTGYLLKEAAAQPADPQEKRPYVAVATREGLLVNEHLGKAREFYVFEPSGDTFRLVEIRPAPSAGNGERRWEELATLLHDCRAVLASAAGGPPTLYLYRKGILVHETEGLIEEGLAAVYAGEEPREALHRKPCGGSGGGCG